ncbi:ABC transporter substrate-binding protein [Dactylosporangium maewongense]|uniref:ABC transporter substrate-binding protein n=1 Tax=Dactylosporangium TaxID=35753 RepID=UPI0031DB9EC6
MNDFPPARLSRRSALLLGLSGAASLALAACGSVDDAASGAGDDIKALSPDGAPGDTPPAGVKLAATQNATIAVSNLPSSIDPMVVVSGGARRFDIYESLIDTHPSTGEPRPFLATEWKQVDPKTWQFTLRQGVKFHDGTPMTAEDVVFSFQRAATQGYGIATHFSTMASARIVDDKTVELVTKTPDVLILKRLAQVAILPKKYYEGLGTDQKARDAAFAKAPIGTGPYKFESYASDKAVVKKAGDTTWRKPTLEKITFLQVTDAGTQLNSLLAGDVHYINIQPLNNLPTLKNAGATLVQLTKGNDLGAFMDSVDNKGKPKTGPMGDKRVRQAIQYALNKEELVKSVLQDRTVADDGQLIGKGLPGYTETVKDYPYDVAKAKAMLDEAGYPVKADGTRFTITMASAFAGTGSVRRLIGEWMQSSISKLGIKVEFTALTDTALQLEYFYNTKQRPDIYHFGLFTRPYMDAARAYSRFVSDSGSFHMNNPEFDKLYKEQLGEQDPAKRQAILAKVTEIFHEESCFLFACADVWVDAAAKNLKGLVQCDVQTEQYYDRLYITA